MTFFAKDEGRELLSLWPSRGPLIKALTMREIAERVAAQYGVTMADLRGPSRLREYAWPRQEAIAAIVATGRYTKSDAGRFFNRTFWTANHAVLAVEAREREAA